MKLCIPVFFLALLELTSARADDGADTLLKALGGSAAAPSALNAAGSADTGFAQDEIKLGNAVARQLFADWNTARTSDFDMNAWVRDFFRDRHEPFAHLWGKMENRAPDALTSSVRSAYLYSLWRLGLRQAFFNEWMKSVSNDAYAQSRASSALEEAIAVDFEKEFLENAIQISGDQEAAIRKIGPARSPIFLSLNAAILRRKGEEALETLARLPLNSAFRPMLAQTASVALARKGDLAGAARALKTYYEPWLLSLKDPRKLALHYLQIARLLYQAGSLEGAVQYYEKVPNGIPEYLTAREELAWCWLRMGDIEKLRGNLKTLTSKLLNDQFQPEAYLVRSISNLKLCYFEEVEKDFSDFLSSNSTWAKTIDSALKAAEPPTPRVPDAFSTEAMRFLSARAAERQRASDLAARSVSAVLPAVGPQKHWTEMERQLQADTEFAQKARIAEFRRQWSNDRLTLQEAIRKMQFVKIELLSQVAALSLQKDQDRITTTAAYAQSHPKMAEKSIEAPQGEMVFPFDGVIWPDELFKLRAKARGRCLGQQ